MEKNEYQAERFLERHPEFEETELPDSIPENFRRHRKRGLQLLEYRDGMEGFYVPESAFRDMMKDAGAQAMQSNINLDGGYGGGLSGEAVALQALQNMYQSASSAISGNIRKNKARIKYNTIVYLINKDAQKN